MNALMKYLSSFALTLALTFGFASTAAAYVGPGAGLSLLGAVWALLAAVFAALAFVLLWPLRRLMKKGRGKGTRNSEHDRDEAPSGSRTAP